MAREKSPSTMVFTDDAHSLKNALESAKASGVLLPGIGSLLHDAIDFKSDACVPLLLANPDAVQINGSEALAAAARRGHAEWVQALLAAGAVPNLPKWRPESDFWPLLIGAMESLDPEVTRLACLEENFRDLEVNWINEALETALGSQKKETLRCLVHLGNAIKIRMVKGSLEGLLDKHLKRLSERLVLSDCTDEEAVALGEVLASFVNDQVATWQILTELVVTQSWDEMTLLWNKQSSEFQEAFSGEFVAWIARCSGALEGGPSRGWEILEEFVDKGASLDGVDDEKRTALMHVVRSTRGHLALIQKLVDRGADIQATVIEENGKRRSVLDYALVGYGHEEYPDFLRQLGARSADERDRPSTLNFDSD